MKLASFKSSNKDGDLYVVSRDLQCATPANEIAPTLQYALDHWQACAPALQLLSMQLNQGDIKNTVSFDPTKVASPLPRSYQWADGSAYVNHVELVRKARGAKMPDSFWTDPLIYQGGSDSFIGPYDPIEAASEEFGIDYEAEIAVITDEVAMGVDADLAADHIKLLMLVNDVSLRNLIPAELAKGFGFYQSKPASAFSPVAVTVDELNGYWDGKKLHLPLLSYINGKLYGQPNAGIDMTFDFPTLIAHAAKTRYLAAGTIIGSGTVANADHKSGSSCLAEKRMLEKIATGKVTTPFLHFGDKVEIKMLDQDSNSIFGSIQQEVIKYNSHD